MYTKKYYGVSSMVTKFFIRNLFSWRHFDVSSLCLLSKFNSDVITWYFSVKHKLQDLPPCPMTSDLLRKLSKIDGTNIKILFFMRVRLTPLSFQNSYRSVKERVQSLSLCGAYLTKQSLIYSFYL